ncbi:hypothetical protein [Zobellia russellii]|uniref:hypothetical protein n=1 Tax=Zobellia russellii TaxID=248907 RepID=UPI001BFF42F4|nr:hypothetical protein [Zobellia russellii]
MVQILSRKADVMPFANTFYKLEGKDLVATGTPDDFTATATITIEPAPTSITYNESTGVYTAPAGSRVTVTLSSSGTGKGRASVSGGGGGASTSWNGLEEDGFSDNDSYQFNMPSSESVTFSSDHLEIFGSSDSRVTITNNQGGTESFIVEKIGGIP